MIVAISSMIHIELLSFSSRLSPEQDPVFNVSPKTPPVVSPIGKSSHLSPRALDQLSPLFQKMEIENPPSLVAPSTTADDLLASIQRSPGTSLHSRNASLPPVGLPLLGNSIWSTTASSSAPQYSRATVALGNGSSYTAQTSRATLPPQSKLASPTHWQSSLPPVNAISGYSTLPTSLSASNGFAAEQPLHGIHQRMSSQPAMPLHSSTFSSLPPQQQLDHLGPSLYRHEQPTLNEPAHPAGSSFSGRLPPTGYTGAYSSPPANAYYRQPQSNFYDTAQQLRREQTFHSPFTTSTISNIWGSPG